MGAVVIRTVFFAAVFLTTAVYAGESVASYTPEISGYASFEAGEVVKGYSTQTGNIYRAWVETGYTGLIAKANVNERLRVIVGGEARLLFSFRRTEAQGETQALSTRDAKTFLFIKHGEAIASLGDPERNAFQLEAGFFPYKYNTDVRNLGEYLFRTFCYPATMINYFDRPFADLAGIRFGHSAKGRFGLFHHDIIFHTSMPTPIMNFWPEMNWSLAYLCDYSSKQRLLSIGAGWQYLNLFTVGVANSHVGKDRTNPDPTQTGDRQVSFAGQKLMARFSIDPKVLFSQSAALTSLLGENDLKLYGEMSILGLKNYKDTIETDLKKNRGYDQLSWRMPIMLGINVPAFKMLDILNFEIEFIDSPYPNSYEDVYYKMLPRPKERLEENLAKLKWSVYIKRRIGEHFSFVCQIARDHLIPYTKPNGNMFADKTDVLLRSTDWWWTGKLQVDF